MFRILVLLAAVSVTLASASEKEVIQAVQDTFDAMAAKDAEKLKKLFLPDARLISVRDTGAVSNLAADVFSTRVGAIAEPILERMWNPKVLLDSKIAVLWAEYDFHRSGKRTHCGIDIVNLVKTDDGWKIGTIQYTVQTSGCKDSPLGPPKP